MFLFVSVLVVYNSFFYSKFFSWEKSFANLVLLQSRLFKAFCVSDLQKCLFLQKLILKSDFARLLAIRQVTQVSSFKKVPGVDGKIFLTFTERFELNELLRINYNNWHASQVKDISILSKDGSFLTLSMPIVSDRVWHLLIKYSIEPIYEYFFHPHSFGFRASYSIFDLQKFVSMNFSNSPSSNQKRVLIFSLKEVFKSFDPNLTLVNLIAPRGIKLGLCRTFNKGFNICFPTQADEIFTLSSIFANILLDGINDVHFSARFGYSVIFILKPFDNEQFIFNNVVSFLNLMKLNPEFTVNGPFSILNGFDFLEWNYIFLNKAKLSITPNFQNYQTFLFRIKRILNNSNYGSTIKSLKLFPIIKEWRYYNRFCSASSLRFSLFYMKKRAFKIFNKESRQDLYSVKRLLKKSFGNDADFSQSFSETYRNKSLYSGHFVFFSSFNLRSQSNFTINSSFSPYTPFCFHCGLKCLF